MKKAFKAAEQYANLLLKNKNLSDSTRTALKTAYDEAMATKDFFCSGKDCAEIRNIEKKGGPNIEFDYQFTLCEENKAKLTSLNDKLAKAGVEAGKKKVEGIAESGKKGLITVDGLIIDFGNELYGDGAEIILKYDKDNSKYGFVLKGQKEGNPIEWKIFSDKNTELTYDISINNTYNTVAYGVNLPNSHDSFFLKAESGGKKISIKLIRKRPVYKVSDLVAVDYNNKNRIAKASANETLYIVRNPLTNRQVEYKWATTAPFEEIKPLITCTPLVGDSWHPQNLYKNSFNIGYTNSPSQGTFAIDAWGYNKAVKVEVLELEGEKIKITTGSETFGKVVKDALIFAKVGDEMTKKLDKIPFMTHLKDNKGKYDGKIGWYFTPIPFEQVLSNKEDYNSPLYFRERKTSGGFEAGIQGKIKIPVWEIPFNRLPLPETYKTQIKEYVKAEVNVIAKADAGGEIKVQEIDKKMIGTQNWIEGNSTINPASIRFKIEFGVEAEISIAKDFPLFSIGAFATGTTKAELFSIGYSNEKWNFFALREGVNLELTAGGYITISGLKYEMDPYFIKIPIIDPIK